jgi:hypothetical protein
MSNTDYVLGEKIRISVIFTDENETETDPDTIKLEIKDPLDAVTTIVYGVGAITKEAVGRYYFDQDADIVGRWFAYWYTEGNFISAGDTVFHVRQKKTAT